MKDSQFDLIVIMLLGILLWQIPKEAKLIKLMFVICQTFYLIFLAIDMWRGQ